MKILFSKKPKKEMEEIATVQILCLFVFLKQWISLG